MAMITLCRAAASGFYTTPDGKNLHFNSDFFHTLDTD